MQEIKLCPKECKRLFNAGFQKIEFGLEKPSPPMKAAYLVLQPGETTSAHIHHDCEIFIHLQGKGEVRSGKKRLPFNSNAIMQFLPFEEHSVTNTANDSSLVFLSLWWEDMNWFEKGATKQQAFDYVITSTPPTPNGDLHLGHLSGPYLRADILRRGMLLEGTHAVHQTGQDDHQSYTAQKARDLKISNKETAKQFGRRIEEALAQSKVELDRFTKPDAILGYQEQIQKRFLSLCQSGTLVKRKEEGFIDSEGIFLFEAFLSGFCPYCHARCRGNLCEECAYVHDCQQIDAPQSTVTSGDIQKIETERYFFPLEPFREKIETFLQECPMNSSLRNWCQSILRKPLPDYPVSFPFDWGVPVPADSGQVISVWFEMGLAHHFFSETHYPDKKLIQCFGKDNAFFNCFLFPAIFMALNTCALPVGLISNEFFLLDNEKFSTSRKHAIWLLSHINEETVEPTRFYLSLQSPEQSRTNFSVNQYEEFVETVVCGKWQETLKSIEKHLETWGGAASSPYLWSERDRQFFNELVFFRKQIRSCYTPASFSNKQAAEALAGFMEQLADYLNQVSPLDPETFPTQVSLELLALKQFAIGLYPIMPEFSKQLRDRLGFPDLSWENSLSWISENTKISLYK